MRRQYMCTVHRADELVRNGSDFSLLSDLIACVDDLVTSESQLVVISTGLDHRRTAGVVLSPNCWRNCISGGYSQAKCHFMCSGHGEAISIFLLASLLIIRSHLVPTNSTGAALNPLLSRYKAPGDCSTDQDCIDFCGAKSGRCAGECYCRFSDATQEGYTTCICTNWR